MIVARPTVEQRSFLIPSGMAPGLEMGEEVLVLCTDGFMEARTAQGLEFGEGHCGVDCVRPIEAGRCAYQGYLQNDDMTMVILEVE